MQVDLNALNASQIALLAVAATSLAAIVGAATAFAVATVNARAAARLARESARRDYRLRTITPYFDFLDKRIAQYHELIDEGPRLSAKLHKVVELRRSQQPEKGTEELAAISQHLNDIADRIIASKGVYHNTGWFAFFLSDQKVLDRLHDWLKKDLAVMNSFVAAGGFTANPEKLKHLSERASEALDEAVSSRRAIEDFVFGSRGWTRRGLYHSWSKLKGAWIRITSNGA